MMNTVPGEKAVKEAQLTARNGPVFIIGAPRSGTTLLQYMLRSHPRISLPTGESHFIVPLYKAAESFGDLREQDNIRRVLDEMYRRNAGFLDTDLHGIKFDPEVLTQELHRQGISTIPQLIRAMLALNAKGEGKQRWGDKTPYYSLHVPLIVEMFPDAQFLHIIRDGRDCALSMLERGKDLDIHNVYQSAGIWKQYVDAAQTAGRMLRSDQYYEFRYEDLLMRQSETVTGICEFLGEEYSDSIINYRKASGSGKTPLLKQPIQKDNSGKWKNRMSDRQVRVFECVAGDTLAKNDYAVATGSGQLGRAATVFYKVHQRIASWNNQRGRRR